jgi:hypothetical protein
VTGRRFFAVVWRANALLILVTAVLACAVLAYGAWQIYRETTRMRQATGIVNVAEERIDRSKVELGRFEAIAGTDMLRAPLQLQQVYGFSSGSKEATSVQNYLFYDSGDGSSHWLVPGSRDSSFQRESYRNGSTRSQRRRLSWSFTSWSRRIAAVTAS